MPRPSLTQIVVVLLVAMLGLMAVSAAYRARSQRTPATTTPAPEPRAVALPDAPPLDLEVPPAPKPAPKPQPTFQVVHLPTGRTVALRSKPGGAVIAHVSSTTQFGSGTTLAVAASRGRWIAVTSTDIPNGTLGWLKRDGLRTSTTHESIRIDLSQRSLELRDGRRVVRRAPVGIGRPGSPTPPGRLSATDKMPGSRYSVVYGCCIVALSGHQVHTPPGWQGGNRLAIHGTNDPGSIGVPSSAGCLHADADDLRLLMRRVPLGAPVFIRA